MSLTHSETQLLVRLIIHDLEKPMAVNERILTRVLDGSLDLRKDAHRRMVEAAQRAAARLKRMLVDLNQVLEGRAPEVRKGPLQLCRLVETLAAEFVPLAESEGIRIQWECDKDHVFVSDADLLHRIVENYLYNAFNHAGYRGRVKLAALVAPGGEVCLRVENTGSSIPEAQLDEIFQVGRQLTLRADRLWRGHGLGLAFCRMAAEALGGRVWAENLPDGAGAAFNLLIPC